MKSITTLIFIIFILMLFKSCTKNSHLFLKDINFNDGEYSLLINHKEKGKFWIDDEQILKNYKKKLKIKGSFINYLPGEGNRSFGLILLKNREVYKSVQGGVFKVFQIGDILDFATPFEKNFKRISVYKTKQELLEEFDFEELKNSPKIYMLSLPEFNPDNFEYRFSVYLPSISVPVHYKDRDTDPYWRNHSILSVEFNEHEIADTLYQKTKNEFKNQNNYKLEKGIIDGPTTSAYVNDIKTGESLKNKKKSVLTATDFRIYNLSLRFLCTKEFYENIKNSNFDKFVSNLKLYNNEEYYNKERFYTAIQKDIENDKKAYTINDFYVDGFVEKFEISDLFQTKHEITYWEKIKE